MRLCFVVNSVRTQRPTYTTSHLACQAARRGHEAGWPRVHGLSLASDGRAAQAVALSGKPRDTRELVATIAAAGAARTGSALDGFSVVFLRNNPAAGADGDRPNPGVEFGRLLKRSGVLVVN